MKKLLLLLAALVAITASAQGALGRIPEKVDYRDARIIDVGTMCADVLQWVDQNPETNTVDTVYTVNHYVLWRSDGDIVVPFANFQRALSAIGQESSSSWIKQHISELGHDHVPAGTYFFKSDDNWELLGNLSLRVFIAKKKLCDLPWNGQTPSSMSTTW